MAGDGLLQNVPTDATSTGTDSGTDQFDSFLSAEWVNERVMNVEKKVMRYIDRLTTQGLLSSGYLPFSTPVTDQMLQRMSPEEFRAIFDTTPTIEGKAALLNRMKGLKLPPRYLLPFEEKFYSPSPALGREPPPAVSSS